jgi:hypothetical protein
VQLYSQLKTVPPSVLTFIYAKAPKATVMATATIGRPPAVTFAKHRGACLSQASPYSVRAAA